MRNKELKLVITFHTTADAMALEKECKKKNIPERLISVPRSISAGCGLAWCAPPEMEKSLREIMQKLRIGEEAIHKCMI